MYQDAPGTLFDRVVHETILESPWDLLESLGVSWNIISEIAIDVGYHGMSRLGCATPIRPCELLG